MKKKGYNYNQNIYKQFFYFGHWILNSKVIIEDKTNLAKSYQNRSVFLAITPQ